MNDIRIVRISGDHAQLLEGMLPDYIIELLKRKRPVIAFAATQKKKVVGALSGIIEDGDFQIISLFVSPEYRRMRVGSALVSKLKEMLEDTDYLISAEYNAVSEEEKTLRDFLLQCEFMEDTESYPCFCEGLLKTLTVRVSPKADVSDDIKMLSKVSKEEIQKAGIDNLIITRDTLYSEKLITDASFVNLEKGNITACALTEKLDNEKIRVHASCAGPDYKEEFIKLLSFTEEALKEKFSQNTGIVVIACNPQHEALLNLLFIEYERITYRFIYY